MDEQDPDTILNGVYYPIFTGPRQQVVEFFRQQEPTDYTVCLGESAAIISGKAFMRLYGGEGLDEVQNET